LVSAISAIRGEGAPFSGLPSVLQSITDADFSDAMITAFNNIPKNLGVNGGLYDAIAGFAPGTYDLLTSITGGTTELNDSYTYALQWAGQTIGGSGVLSDGVLTGNPKKFGTILNTAQSYAFNANQMINASTNSTSLNSTFTNLDRVVSGGLSGVNLDLDGFGTEVAQLGETVNFAQLENLGSPGQLLNNMIDQGTLGPLYNKLSDLRVSSGIARALGVNIDLDNATGITLNELGVDLNAVARQGASLPAGLQKQIYDVLGALDENEVRQVKSILKCTQNAVVIGTDLLDPTKLFANSFITLTAPIRTSSVGFRSIYENSSGSVNAQFTGLGTKLQNIMPSDIAVANGALSRSLLQVKNIGQTESADLGEQSSSLETLKDLDLLESQSEYVPEAVRNYWIETYGVDNTYNVTLATGNAGQLKVSDIIGFAAGYNSAAPLTKNSQLLTEMNNENQLTAITGSKGIYDTINEFCAGTFGPTEDPPASGNFEVNITAGYVGEGTYTGASSSDAFENAWINGVVPAIQTILASYSSNTRAIEIMTNSERWNTQLAREYLNQLRADNEDLTAVRASDDVAINLATNLSAIGRDVESGGVAEILERIVDFGSLGGQATIAAMREGRNLQRLADANIQQDALIDTSGIENPAVLSTSTYSSQQAFDQLIKS